MLYMCVCGTSSYRSQKQMPFFRLRMGCVTREMMGFRTFAPSLWYRRSSWDCVHAKKIGYTMIAIVRKLTEIWPLGYIVAGQY